MAEPNGAGAEVRRLRLAAGLTLAQLAGTCGVTKAFIGQIETGTRVGFGPDLIFRLSHALGVGCEHWRQFFAPELTDVALANSPTAEPPTIAPSEPDPPGKPVKKPRKKTGR